MTISTTIIKNSYSGDASNDTFAYQFKISTTADMQVIIRSAAGVETVKTLTTHYTVTGAGAASGGNVVFESGHIPAATETVILRRSTTQTQALDLVENDPFTADSVENAFDKNLALVQELQEQANRSLKISRTNTMTSTEFTNSATDRASKVLAFDASGELSVTQELGTYKGTSATTTTAAFVVRDIVKGSTAAQLNNIYICIQASPIGTALTNTAYWVLIINAVAAAASAVAAAASAVDATNNGAAKVTLAAAQVALATTQAGNAATSASTASGHKDTATTKASEAASSASASANSATAAAASADAFDDIYLGTKSSDPSTDNDGDALAAGMLYFNSTNDILRVYSGSAWQDAALSSTGVVTLTGTQTLTNKTLTDAVAITNSVTGEIVPGKNQGTNFDNSILIGHATTGTLNAAIHNTGVGIDALNSITSGDYNTAIGSNALTALDDGERNVGIGFFAGVKIQGGDHNIAIGHASLAEAIDSQRNTAVGYQSGNKTTGNYNTFHGYQSGLNIANANYNLNLGWTAGDNITSGSGNVSIGAAADPSSATGNRQLTIGGYDGSTTTTWISGSSAGVVTFNAANVTQQAITSSSNAVAWDSSAKPNAVHITTENTTFSAPSNSIEGAFICVEINYNGSHSIAWNTVFEFAASTAPTFTSTDGKTDIMVFRYNGAVWQEVGRTINLSES